MRQNYKVPDWFSGAKFGIFMHFGIFSVPAHQSEWYEKFMYAGGEDSTLQTINNLNVELPASPAADSAYTLKIRGIKTNPPTTTPSGNPLPNNRVTEDSVAVSR